MANAEAGDLAVLLPGREVIAKGETLVVMPLFFGQYPKAIKLVRPLATVVTQSGAFSAKPVKGADGKETMSLSVSDDWLSALPLILEQGGEALIQFFAFAINKPREWFDTLPGDEGFAVAKAILQENADFFARKIRPQLESLGLVSMVQTDQAGEQSSQSSAASDTVGPTSN